MTLSTINLPMKIVLSIIIMAALFLAPSPVNGGADAAKSDAELYSELQQDILWKEKPKLAVEALADLLKRNKDLGFEILVKRFDGWSMKGLPLPNENFFSRSHELYSLKPLLKQTPKEDMPTLFHVLATKDFDLATAQKNFLHGTVVRVYGNYEAFEKHLNAVVSENKYSPDQVKRLKMALRVGY